MKNYNTGSADSNAVCRKLCYFTLTNGRIIVLLIAPYTWPGTFLTLKKIFLPRLYILVSLTVLVYEHANTDAIQVEAVEEILDAVLDVGSHARRTFHLQNSLSHALNHRQMPVSDVV